MFNAKISILFIILVEISVMNGFSNATNITNNEIPLYDVPVIWSGEPKNVTFTTDYLSDIMVNITVCNINGENGEHVIIRSGQSESILFSYTVTENPRIVFNSNKVEAIFMAGNDSNFTAVFTRIERTTETTTVMTTTEVFIPTSSVNDSTSITVYLYGRNITEYHNGSSLYLELKKVIADMAAEYCSTENFYLNQSITANNVIFEDIDHCPLSWNEPESCAKVIFRVPIVLEENSPSKWTGYQLSADHVRIMWLRLAEKYLNPIGLSIYSGPDLDSFLVWRISTMCIVLVIIIVLFSVLKCVLTKYNNKRRRKLSDIVSIIESERDSHTSSRYSQSTHYLQELPPLFENFSPIHNTERRTAHFADTPTRSAEYRVAGTGECTQNEVFNKESGA